MSSKKRKRREDITLLVLERGSISVEALADTLNVSTQTIRRDVDALCDQVASYFQQNQSLSVSAVRRALLRTSLGGYDEAQVDALLDDTISVMLAVR